MPRGNGSIIGLDVTPNAGVASGIWTVREAERYLRSGGWPSAPTVPGAPTGIPGNGQVELSWTAPAGNIPATDYIVQYSSNAGATWTTFSDGVSSATSAQVTGLTNGVGYIFRVVAVNALGEGPYGSASGTITPVPWDTVALLHFDGTNGSTAFTESSGNLSVTAEGDALISTSQSKFGGASMYTTGANQNSGAVILDPNEEDLFATDTGDWTIEFWFRPDELQNANLFIISSAGFSSCGLQASITSGGALVFNDGCAAAFSGGDYTDGVWQHFALVRSSGTATLYIDGVSQGSQTFAGGTAGNALAIGASAISFGSTPFFGYIDEFRFVRNAVYTGAFTPPSSPF